MGKRIVIALGGNALGNNLPEQMAAVKQTARAIADLIEDGHQVILSHGNGPQVGMIQKAMAELTRSQPDKYIPCPLSVCVAMSQGYIGYDLQNAIRTELLNRGIYKNVSTVLTQVVVDPYDDAFYHPTKIIGRIMNAEEADIEERKGNHVIEVPGGYRRIVAAPKPIDIIEAESIRALLDADQIVIACGGGGIPVIEQQHILKGASAVIEKDSIAGKLAGDLQADRLIILTGVPCVYKNFGTAGQEAICSLTVAEAASYIEEKQFGEGNMLPKITASIAYLQANPNGSVLITSLEHAAQALKGKAGTVIRP